MPEVRFDPDRNFRSHILSEEQKLNVEDITEMCITLANTIKEHCPGNGETMLALRHLEDAKMRAVQSIACGPA